MSAVDLLRQDAVEEVDLTALTFEELLAEREAVGAEITDIGTQLVNRVGRPAWDEDDSPEWDRFRDWRRRARWALMHRKRELAEIKTLLVQHHESRRAANEERKKTAQATAKVLQFHTEAEAEAYRSSARGRKAALLETLATPDGQEALLLRLYRVVRHLLPDGGDLPPQVTDDDREALGDVAKYLRHRFTTSGVREFVTDGAS